MIESVRIAVKTQGHEVRVLLPGTRLEPLRRPETPDQVLVYFGQVGASSAPERTGLSWLSFSGRQVTLDDLWTGLQQRKLANAPLVILNACDSAELDPTFYRRITPYLDAVGARGLLGSEGYVPPLFAAEWASRFFQRFLYEGLLVGEVLRLLRKEFYAEHHNLLGLLYALYCDSDTRIVPPL